MLQSTSASYLSSLHERKKIRDEARRERDRRRRKLFVEQQAAAEAAARSRDEEMLLSVLMRASRDEARLAEEFASRQLVKEDMRRRRMAREQMYAERRQRDFEDAIARDAEIARRLRADYEAQAALERKRYAELREAAAAEAYRQTFEYCQHLVTEIIDTSLDDIILDDIDATDYVRGEGEWPVLSVSSAVGPCVAALRDVAFPPPPPPPPPDIPPVPVSLCVIGGPFTGKSTVADAVARSRHMLNIQVDALVKQAIETAQSGEVDDGLAKQVLESTQAGSPVPDDVLVGLIVAAITDIDKEQFPGGWVVDGFPHTKAQAAALEKALTGYEPPPPPPEPKRGARAKQAVAPVPAEPPGPQPVSGIDVVLKLDLEHEQLLGRLPQTVELGSAQLQKAIQTYDATVPELTEWFARFNNMRTFDTSAPVSELVDQLAAIVDTTAIAKKELQDEKQRAEEEAARLAEEQAEAERQKALEAAALAGEQPPADIVAFEQAKAEAEAKAAKEQEEKERAIALEKELAEKLLDVWKEAEDRYVKGLHEAFRGIRHVRRFVLDYVANTRREYREFLQRPDDCNEKLTAFVRVFNSSMEDSLRRTDEGKAELHIRTDELRDLLWGMMDKAKEEAEAERQAIVGDGLIAHANNTLQEMFVRILQLEIDRYTVAKQLMSDFFAWRAGKPLKDEIETPLALIIDPTEEAAAGTKGRKGQPAKPSPAKPAAATKPAAGKPGAKAGAKADDAAAPDNVAIAVAKINETLFDGSRQLTPPEDEDPLRQQEYEALIAEETLLKERVQAIDARSHALMADATERVQDLYSQMEQGIATTFRSNVDAVRSVVRVIKDAIEQGELVNHDIRMAEGSALVDEGVMVSP